MAINDGDAVKLDGPAGNLALGGAGAQGDLSLLNSGGVQTAHLDGGEANFHLGGGGAQGDIILQNGHGEQTIQIDGGDANIVIGGSGAEGDIMLRNGEGDQTIHLDGGEANIWVGGSGRGGDLTMRNFDGESTIHLDGQEGVIRINGVAVQTADHVFAPGYPLPKLAEVARHIETRGHLPGVPSAAAMRADGVDLMQMMALLLAKVEELTLYTLQQDERLRALETR